jgi:hypothetical protein
MSKLFIKEGKIKKRLGGYIWIKIGTIWIAEHRLICEDLLGRQLTKEETVHHINFIKTDNRPENLALFENQKEHSSWHRQFAQFGWTRPLIKKIESRKLTNIRKNIDVTA